MKKQHLFISVLALCLMYGCDAGSGNRNTADNSEDSMENARNLSNQDNQGSDFLKEAAEGGMMEVQLGQLAQQKASMPEVKNFGQRMVTDHSKANQELKDLAQQKNIAVPASLSEKTQKDVDKLSKLSGQEFDKQYMDMMVKDHKKDVNEFEKASQKVSDPEIKSFASKTLPTLREHLQMAEDINQQMKNS